MLCPPSFTTCVQWLWAHGSYLARRRVLARILSTFICALLIVIRPFSHLGGSSAFLVLTLKELVFSVNETLPQQLEATFLNLAGAFIGIGISTLARYLSALRPDDSASARAIPAIFLVLLAFFAGLAKSALPRLLASARISCFLAVFILSTNPGLSSRTLDLPKEFVWIALTPAVVCLFSSFVFLPWFRAPFADDVAGAFQLLHSALEHRMAEASIDFRVVDPNEEKKTPTKVDLPQMAAIRRTSPSSQALLQKSIQLNASYAQANFELRIGRLNVKRLKPLIASVEYLRRELTWGKSTYKHRHHSETIATLQPAALQLSRVVLEALDVVQNSIKATYKYRLFGHPTFEDEVRSVHALRTRLLEARDYAREQLKATSSVSRHGLSQERSDYCLFLISLLQMAHECRQALEIVRDLLTTYNKTPTRLWTPHLSRGWLGVSPHQVVPEERPDIPDDPIPLAPVRRLSVTEAQAGILEHRASSASTADGLFDPRATFRARYAHRLRSGYRSWWPPHKLWQSDLVLNLRLRIAPFIRSVLHSKHLQHAFKNALGVGLLSIPAFYPISSPARMAWEEIRGQWMVITYVWVLETNTGATWRVGYLRLSGTIIGATYAFITWLICRTNPFGLVALITFADVPISYIVTRTSFASLGVVSSITLPPIAFAQFMTPDLTTPVIILASYRAAMIAAGIVAALAVNMFLWPRHCRVLFLESTSQTLGLLSQLYLMLGRDLFLRSLSYHPRDHRKLVKLELHIRNSLSRLSALIVTMDDELSLMPKPMSKYRQTVENLQAVLDIMTGIRKIRENIPIRETVAPVLAERREFVSTICLFLYAIEHAFRARQPLPQFLPSCRAALLKLLTHIEAAICQGQSPGSPTSANPSSDLSLVYTLAESEVLKDLVDAVEGLLGTCRVLFGTATWLKDDRYKFALAGGYEDLSETPSAATSMLHVDHSHHGWYSN
ncbi:unnamed protein product [Peniophora sp. CBMAI 1063]|nr:unnamed protein product [Peniophora sp. CBMAI 1063]